MGTPLEALADRIRQHPKLVIADDFEIVVQRSHSRAMRYRNGSLFSATETDRVWLSLRILHRKRGGKAVFLNPTPESIGTLVDAAYESANRAAVDPWFRFPIWKTPPKASAPAEIPFEYQSLNGRLSPACSDLEEAYEARRQETLLRRKTEKQELRYSDHAHFLGLSLLGHSNGEEIFLQEEHGVRGPLTEREAWLDEMTQTVESRGRRAAKPCGRGRRKVVIAPAVAARLLRAMGSWFFADAVQSGRSPLQGRLGQTAFAECLSLSDYGNHPDSPWSAPFDLEGALTQRTILVEKGTIKNWLYDVYCATRENRLTTANRLRAEGEMHPRIGSSTLYWEPGEKSRQGLLELMSNGIYLDHIEVFDTPVSPTGKFSLRGTGWRVAFGQCSEPLTGIEMEFDAVQLLHSASAVGRDLRFYAGYGSPSILLEEVPLGR